MITQNSRINTQSSLEDVTCSSNRHIPNFLSKFRSLTRFYALFHIAFLSVGFLQLLSMLLFFSFFTKSTWSALAIAALFLTAFSYFVLHFYFQAKKPQQFLELRNEFHEKSASYIAAAQGSGEYYTALSASFMEISEHLNDKEATYYPLPKNFKTLSPLLEKFSIWVHWKDILKMKELLLLSSINETVSLVKMQPTALDAHAHLASAYLALSKIYMNPRKANPHTPLLWVSPEYESELMQNKFHAASDRAVEELTILNDYAPSDPWIHAQLAQIYHDKGLAHLEIKEYETLLKIHPSDKEILYRLGVLYFKQGQNSLGLKVYEQLRSSEKELAESLIKNYDAFQFHELTIETLSI